MLSPNFLNPKNALATEWRSFAHDPADCAQVDRFAPRRFIANKVIAAVLATYGFPLRGKSMPNARSPPSSTAKNVTIVAGKPKMRSMFARTRSDHFAHACQRNCRWAIPTVLRCRSLEFETVELRWQILRQGRVLNLGFNRRATFVAILRILKRYKNKVRSNPAADAGFATFFAGPFRRILLVDERRDQQPQ